MGLVIIFAQREGHERNVAAMVMEVVIYGDTQGLIVGVCFSEEILLYGVGKAEIEY